jgi:tetraacyldisaccharide 4'-kinase
LSPYGALTRLRRRLYASGRLRSETAPLPVVSVGNLTWGGTGKSPLVEWLARRLRARGRAVGVVLRGYGRRSRGVRVVSDECGPILGAEEAGDEASMLARNLPGVPVVVAEDRADGARRAATLGAGIVLLDDGFQHLRLRRDLDIVLVDARRPLGGGLPPLGRAREHPSALFRADLIVVTRCDDDLREGADAQIRRWNPVAPLFHSRIRFREWIGEDGERAAELAAGPTVAVCAIGDPESFRRTLSEAGARPLWFRAFRDHFSYPAGALRRIERQAQAAGAGALLTTEKDRVKIAGRVGLPVVAARTEIEMREEGFFEEVVRSLERRGIVV